MDAPDQPRIYLISPPQFEPEEFAPRLASVLDAHDVACIRLALMTRDEDALARAADALREVASARDVALVIAEHTLLAQRLGLDGVHLTDTARSVRHARKTLGADAIVGAYCAGSRHEGMSAGEAGADYVAFGPVRATSLAHGVHAEDDLFEWWSEMIEIPCVAEGALDADRIRALAPYSDFFGISEIWEADDPAAALADLRAAMAP